MNRNRILIIPLKQYGEGACVIYSASARSEGDFGNFRVKNNFSFCYIMGDYAVEWEPEYGPIQVWHSCNKDDEGAREHYIFDYTDSDNLNWSQLAVDRYQLPVSTYMGDWQYIFDILRGWAER